MAAPNTDLLTSSAQIFASNHTLPQIRAIHKALHVQIDDKAARLRTQVGGSYRELLGTADAIVQMRADMDAVQDTLARMGGRCGRAVVGAKVAGLSRFVQERAEAEAELGLVARARLLEACALTVGRVLSPGGTTTALVVVSGTTTTTTTTTTTAAGEKSKRKEEEEEEEEVVGSRFGDDGGRPLKKKKKKKKAPSRGARLVVAAKILVLSRLLAKSLGEEEIGDPDVAASVEASKKALEGHRRKLRRSIEKVLELAGGDAADREDVLQALCAYSLANSSGARDVLRHFLSVRGEAMALAFEVEENERGGPRAADVLRSLGLYTKTLLDVQALVPHKLTDALMSLKKDALLADEALRRSEGLRLDVYKRWCGDDIRYFKPYIRHDDLDGKQARDMLSNWASRGGEVLLDGLGKTLDRLFEFKSIMDLRTDVLRLWIRDGGKARGFDPSAMLDKIRGTINKHMLEVLHMKVGKLRLVGSEVAAALEAWHEGVTGRCPSLWDDGSFDMDLSDGAGQFTHDVVARLYGRNDAVSKAVACYRSWQHVIDDVGAVVDRLRRQRWDNDVDEIEDEETIEHRQRLLSRDDPQLLHDRLDAALEKAFAELDRQLAKEWEDHKEEEEEETGSEGKGEGGARERSGHIAMYFARVLRDIRSRLPGLPAVQRFGLGIVPALHERIAAAVAVAPLDEFAATALTRKTVVGRSLWEGEPELPTSPSPGAFRFLRDLSVAMGDAGMDLWSPAAVAVLRRHMETALGERWLEALAAHQEDASAAATTAATTAVTITEDGGDKGTEKSEDKDTERGGDEEQAEGSSEEKEEQDPKQEAEPDAYTQRAIAPSLSPEQRQDLLLQWLFDILWLRCCLAPPTSQPSTGKLQELEDAVVQQAGLGDAVAVRQRLAKATQDYWKRTSLLFGLLT